MSNIVDFNIFKKTGHKVDPAIYARCIGTTMDEILRDKLMVDVTLERAMQYAALRAEQWGK